MSTFGPVWVPNASLSISPRPCYNTGVRSESYAYFQDMDSPDDYKPVVHCKMCDARGNPCEVYGDYSTSGFVQVVENRHYWRSTSTSFSYLRHYWTRGSSNNMNASMVWVDAGSIQKHPSYSWYFSHGTQAWFRIKFSDAPRIVGQPCIATGAIWTDGYGYPRSNYFYERLSSLFVRLVPRCMRWTTTNGFYTCHSDELDRALCDLLDTCLSLPLDHGPYIGTIWYRLYLEPIGPPATVPFLFGEQSIFGWGAPYCIGSPAQYWLNYGRQHAFADACANMPRLSDNSISNLSEVLEFLLAVVRREPPKLPTTLWDAWLGYRYQYSTTKADIEEAWEFVNRVYDLDSIFVSSRIHGQTTFRCYDTDVTCRVSLDVSPATNRWYNDLGALWRDLSTLGLAPDLYYLWDSTPFSFIVDWFLPVGSVVEAIDASNLYTAEHYNFSNVVYSLSYTRRLGNGTYKCYSRWLEQEAPAINPYYWLEPNGPASKRQVLYRTFDALSLTIGRR